MRSHWPTPDTQNDRDGTKRRKDRDKGTKHGESLHHTVARIWQTPSVADVTGGHMTRGGARSGEMLLKGQAQNWPTPYGLGAGNSGPDGNEFSTFCRNWSTPNARDWKGEDIPGRNGSPSLPAQVMRSPEQWMTPRAMQAPEKPATVAKRAAKQEAIMKAGGPRYGGLVNIHSQAEVLASRLDQTTPQAGNDGSPQEARPRLNPDFVEALMGLPRGWTVCDVSETASCQPRPPSLSPCCASV
jgi:hypothetical protein